MSLKKLIITADDYGMCPEVNKAIDDCMAIGLVTSTNVMANMDYIEDAKTLRHRFPEVSVGIHWNVVTGKPVATVESLVDEKTGEFYPITEFFHRYKQGLITRKDIETELIAQYEVFHSICGNADYWNTHVHTALNLKTFDVFNELALKLGISRSRTFRRCYVKDKRIFGLKAKTIEFIKKNVLDIWFGYKVPQSGVQLPDGFLTYFDVNQPTENIENISDNIVWGSKNIVELMIHPSISSDYKYFGNLNQVRVKEWKVFSNMETKQHLSQKGVELVNFNALGS